MADHEACAKLRKVPVRFGSVRFLIWPVPVPTVRFQNPVPTVPVPPVPKNFDLPPKNEAPLMKTA